MERAKDSKTQRNRFSTDKIHKEVKMLNIFLNALFLIAVIMISAGVWLATTNQREKPLGDKDSQQATDY